MPNVDISFVDVGQALHHLDLSKSRQGLESHKHTVIMVVAKGSSNSADFRGRVVELKGVELHWTIHILNGATLTFPLIQLVVCSHHFGQIYKSNCYFVLIVVASTFTIIHLLFLIHPSACIFRFCIYLSAFAFFFKEDKITTDKIPGRASTLATLVHKWEVTQMKRRTSSNVQRVTDHNGTGFVIIYQLSGLAFFSRETTHQRSTSILCGSLAQHAHSQCKADPQVGVSHECTQIKTTHYAAKSSGQQITVK